MHPVVHPVGRPPAQDPHGVAMLRTAQAHSNLSAAGSAVVGTRSCPLSIPVPLEPLVPASNCRRSGAPSTACVPPPAPPPRRTAGRMGVAAAGPLGAGTTGMPVLIGKLLSAPSGTGTILRCTRLHTCGTSGDRLRFNSGGSAAACGRRGAGGGGSVPGADGPGADVGGAKSRSASRIGRI